MDPPLLKIRIDSASPNSQKMVAYTRGSIDV